MSHDRTSYCSKIYLNDTRENCGVTDIVEEILTVSAYCWDKINIG